jgi:hypothetical protein
MRYDRTHLKQTLMQSSIAERALFSFLCAERLHGCCWAYAQIASYDSSAYIAGCNLLYDQLTQESVGDDIALKEMKKKVEASAISSDEDGSPLAVQAQSGVLTLLYAFDSLEDDSLESILRAASYVVEALDNYQYYVHKTLAGISHDPKEYLLLDREITWQRESLSMIMRDSQVTKTQALSLRLLNRSYLVPIAL